MFELTGTALIQNPYFRNALETHLLPHNSYGCDVQWPDAKHEKRHFSITKESLTSIHCGSKWNAVCCFSCSALMKQSDLECQQAGSFSRNFPPCKTKHVSVWALKAPPGECEMPATWKAIISCSWRRRSEFHSFWSAEVRGWSLSLAPILALAKPWDDCCRTGPAKRCQLGRDIGGKAERLHIFQVLQC